MSDTAKIKEMQEAPPKLSVLVEIYQCRYLHPETSHKILTDLIKDGHVVPIQDHEPDYNPDDPMSNYALTSSGMEVVTQALKGVRKLLYDIKQRGRAMQIHTSHMPDHEEG